MTTLMHTRRRKSSLRESVLRPITPIVLAMLTSALIMLALGKNPVAFGVEVLRFGVLGSGWQNSLVVLAPLMLIAVGLTVAFRAGFWNLGYDGQFLLPAVLVTGVGPSLISSVPLWLAIPLLLTVAIVAGALWALIPAWLRVHKQANEIVTTLSMSFIAIGVANLLIRGPFKDSTVALAQTASIPDAALLSFIPGTRIHVGVIFALLILAVAHVLLTRTSLGVRLDILGGSPKTARHVGIRAGLATLVIFAVSGAAIAAAGFVDMMGVWGYARTDWNPAYGLAVIPFVLIARLNLLAALPLLAFFAIFETGTVIAAQRADISVDFVIVMVALILGFMALTEWMFNKRQRAAYV